MNQHKYIQDLITLSGLKDTSSVDTAMEVNVKYRKDEGDLLDEPTLYRCLVGSLIHLTTTRPDISYVVHQVSQFMSSPRHLHLVAVRRIIHYLRGSPTRGLFFPTDTSLQLVAYSDADWAGCLDTPRSTTGWCMFLGDALISWRCKKQDRVSKSSTEAKDMVSLRSLGFLILLLLLFMLITLVLFRLPPIPFSMNAPSTLKLIVILFETLWKVG